MEHICPFQGALYSQHHFYLQERSSLQHELIISLHNYCKFLMWLQTEVSLFQESAARVGVLRIQTPFVDSALVFSS